MSDSERARAELTALMDGALARRLLAANAARPSEASIRERRRAFLAESARHLDAVHRREAARLLFVEAQLVLRQAGAGELGLCGLRAEPELTDEARARRSRIERAAALRGEAPPAAPPADGVRLAVAAELLERSLELDPDSLVRASLGLVLALGGSPERALRLLEQAGPAATPRATSRSWEATACALDRSGRPAEAARAYDEAAEADPSNEAASLFALYFALEHGADRDLERAAARLAELPTVGPEGRDVIDVQRRALDAGAWRPSPICLERAAALASRSRPQLDHALEVLLP